MKADPKGVLTGEHYLDGDHACAEGALAAGCRFFAGYPITPSTEVAERYVSRIPTVGGIFIQMEDELGSMAALVGAAWGGKKAMTVTSGPGFSLMMENIGLAAMMETPCVVVNVQRGGPSTGLPTMVGQQDMMQARWGSHGDYQIIALSPASPQEAFDYTIKCFNLAEKYRVPVLFMMDECVGHMTEKVVIPKPEDIEITPRRLTKLPPEKYLPYKTGSDLVPDMIVAGTGYHIHSTGLTHDERGYPVMSPVTQNQLVKRLCDKIKLNADDIIEIEEDQTEDAEVIVMAYGITSRVCLPAVFKARKKGIKVGYIKLITVWPFPEKRIRELAQKVKAFIMPEINLGQVVLEVERCAAGQAKTYHVPHAGGWVHDPEDIYQVIEEAVK
ncbi:MAG: 2-oxoacid:acceptor oxidoreductase subunit alpha [candidate division KSB1 bacterium]|nr:2-oxoacid:acceptor oxidoreductase subunit alpha [candidate division KSB1 bacterium]